MTVSATLDLEAEIRRLKTERKAVLLAHYYQDSEIQDVADFVGDSLQLSQQAAATNADVILFAGVHFMAETAKIVNPGKTVILPDLDAGCSLAEGCPAPQFEKFLARFPGHTVISYINCSAAVKALSDIICTSSNAVAVVESVPRETPIVFAPDQHLGRWVMKQTGRPMILWPGSCLVHELFNEREIVHLKHRNPGAPVLAHPECDERVLAHADYVGSTSGILAEVLKSPAMTFIIATEPGIIHQMKKLAPTKNFIPAPAGNGCACNNCPFMKMNTLEKVYLALRDLTPEITLEETLRARAELPLRRMLAISAGTPKAAAQPVD
ncbi:MAG: quinolinate synthase NadA [Candidatus Eisenbacteria bacterium]|nr:quinolinate synthase NadA [Candidatus Eisenbacteria bacterium]